MSAHETEQDLISDVQRFPSLKDTLVVRMAERAGEAEAPKASVAPAYAEANDGTIALPAVVGGPRLKTELPHASQATASEARWRSLLIVPFGLITAVAAVFSEGFLPETRFNRRTAQLSRVA